MAIEDEYDVFISYYENTAKDYAEYIRNVLWKDRKYKVFVYHILAHLTDGERQTIIDTIINKCKIFVLLNTYGSLDRDEVIREVKVAFPNGDFGEHKFWILRRDKFDQLYATPKFEQETKINLTKIYQDPFKNESELGEAILRKCDNERKRVNDTSIQETQPASPPSIILTVELQDLAGNQDRINLLKRIDNEFYKKDYSKALELLDIAIQQVKEAPPDFLYDKALLLSNLGRNDESLNILNELLQKESKNPDYNYLAGIVSQRIKNYEKAIDYYDNVISLQPNNSKALNSKASALENLGQLKEATILLNAAISSDPKNADAWYNLGVIHFKEARYTDALKAYEKAAELNPVNPKAFINKGVTQRILGRYNEALESYDKAIKLNPENPIPYHNKGLLHAFMGKYQQSLNLFNVALNKNPRYTAALVNRGASFVNLGNLKKALRDFRKARQIEPQDVITLYNEGGVLVRLHRYAEAENVLKQARNKMNRNIDVLMLLGEALFRQDKFDEAH